MTLWQSKCQVSLEYLVILGIALFLLIPIMGLFFNSTLESQNINKSNILVLSGRTLVSTAEDVFYQGKGSKVKVQINLPDDVSLRVKSGLISELVMSTSFENQMSDFVFFTDTNLSFSHQESPCSVSSLNSSGSVLGGSGQKTLFVESCGNYVVIYSYDE